MSGFRMPRIKAPKASKSSVGKVSKFVTFKPTITKTGKFRQGGVRLVKRRAA